MAKVVVLGGCGAVGSVAVRTLVAQEIFSQVVIADANAARAAALATELASDKVAVVGFDANEASSVRQAVSGSDVVLNCVGPFFKTVKTILQAVIESGINYVDICDDVDVTLEILDMDARARAAGVKALIGMGSSPGATNVIARFIYDNLLDETESIDIFHTHGGEPFEGEGVIGHRFHCMSIDIPMFLDGAMQYVRYFEPDGIALRQTFDFPVVGECPIYPYPHPEQVTMPRYLKVRQVTNKGSVLPNDYYNLTRDLCGLGLGSREILEVGGVRVVPYDFAVAFILKRREEILRETQFGSQRGCCTVVVRGRKDGQRQEYRVHMASSNAALGEGTGLPAAMGTMLMVQGKVAGKGVMPPEACIDPADFLALSEKVMMKGTSEGELSSSKSFIIAERVDETGQITRFEI